MLIRTELPEDYDAIRKVNSAAFETTAEANLVDALREQTTVISLVAEERGTIVGHILFSPVSLPDNPELKVAGLAPMAVTPDHQRKGIGRELVQAGLDRCKEHGFVGVVVLGHPEYYPRFGFSPSTKFGLRSEYDVPEEVFMAMELIPGALSNQTGTVQYHAVFANV